MSQPSFLIIVRPHRALGCSHGRRHVVITSTVTVLDYRCKSARHPQAQPVGFVTAASPSAWLMDIPKGSRSRLAAAQASGRDRAGGAVAVPLPPAPAAADADMTLVFLPPPLAALTPPVFFLPTVVLFFLVVLSWDC